MILIYSDSQIIDIDWLPKIDFGDIYRVCHKFSEYIASDAPRKIAFTTHRLHCDDEETCPAYHGFEDKILQLSAVSEFVFSFESELHNFHWQIWEQCHRPNVYWCLPGYVNDRDDINDNIICWGDWFKTTAMLYQKLPEKLAEIEPYKQKPRHFDALLGAPKPHRDFVFNAVNQAGLQNQIVMTYGGKWSDDSFYAKDYFIWEQGTVPVGKTLGTADWAEYYGHRTHLSQIIPIRVYNDTAYSIIAETDHDNTLSCFTEKTAKPLLARRLFVAFTGYKFLHNLRRLGFQTFSDAIDESYDLEIDDHKRYTMAFEQVQLLCQQDQIQVYNKLRPVLEHNYEIVLTRDWTQWAADQITERIRSYTN
jgi:hypothetical protein